MKGSGVVQGLKSLADKIHPQMPLTAKESSRLLTALTSSFRNHLDEAHPWLPEEDRQTGKNGRDGEPGVSKTNISAMYSSAAYAQRHMASVLTNPLLVKGVPRLDYDTAKAELQKNPARDPIELLEEYHEKGAASVRIAELCLEHASREYKSYSLERRLRFLQKGKPGLRVFRWLLRNKLHDSTSYADNVRFIDFLVYFLINGGHEEHLWQWLKLDIMTPASASAGDALANTSISYSKEMHYKYRWRGRILRSMVITKVGVPDLDAKGFGNIIDIDGVHAAMDTLLRAVNIRKSVEDHSGNLANTNHLWWYPIGAAGSYLTKLLTTRTMGAGAKYKLDRSKIDIKRYEKLIDGVPYYTDSTQKIHEEAEVLSLELCHPRAPTADRVFTVMRELFTHRKPGTHQRFIERLGRDQKASDGWATRFIQCIYVLQSQGKMDEAARVRKALLEHFPAWASSVEQVIRHFVASSNTEDDPGTVSGPEPTRTPLASLV